VKQKHWQIGYVLAELSRNFPLRFFRKKCKMSKRRNKFSCGPENHCIVICMMRAISPDLLISLNNKLVWNIRQISVLGILPHWVAYQPWL